MPPRAVSLFKPSDIAKAIAAVEKAGKKVTRVEIGRDGGIVIGMSCQDLESIEPHARDLDLIALARGEINGKKGKNPRSR